MNITWIGSPNFDTNRKPIDRIVIHWIVGNLASADAQFQKSSPGTSAHYGIENNSVHQYVKDENVAYHAGVYTMNQRSIGIEHSASPDRPATETTYKTSSQLIADICRRYSIPCDREHIIKHSEVKNTACPGTIDIDKLITMAREILAPGGTTTDLQRCERDRDHLRDEMKKFEGYFNSIADTLQVERNFDVVKGEISKLVGYEDKVIEKDKQIEDAKNGIEALNKSIKDLTDANDELVLKGNELEDKVKKQAQETEAQAGKIELLTRELAQVQKLCQIPNLKGFKKSLVDFILSL